MQEEMGLMHLWSHGDWVTRAVALLLLAMSLASWAVLLLRALDIWRARGLARRVPAFWQQPGYEQALAALGDAEDNPFADLARAGHDASREQGGIEAALQSGLSASDWITRALQRSIEDSQARLQTGLAVLASVGSTAPFVGLFGTVWGIYHALMGIGAAGQATIDQVAGPIGEALIMTALGLAVAIPAVLGYNALVRGNKAVSRDLQRFAHDLQTYFVTGARQLTKA
ncbi:MAG TPA: MotA/TolQ/ExbB proton channel family protein [Burkholderiaceae bacterium]|jgi:biopolymer transport protein ExbB|nr:MotA/TolQ/ExbB proton channel family protein [Burkholderiaceae bacterium]